MSEEFTETVYEHVSGRDTFTVTAAEQWSKTMVNNLKKKHPDDVDIRCTNPDGSMVVHLPASWMKIKPTYKINYTDEQRAEKAERMRANRRTIVSKNDPSSNN